MKRRVVITGMGMITPLGTEVSQVWDGILAGRSGIHRLSIIDPTRSKFKSLAIFLTLIQATS